MEYVCGHCKSIAYKAGPCSCCGNGSPFYEIYEHLRGGPKEPEPTKKGNIYPHNVTLSGYVGTNSGFWRHTSNMKQFKIDKKMLDELNEMLPKKK